MILQVAARHPCELFTAERACRRVKRARPYDPVQLRMRVGNVRSNRLQVR
ncbi:MAG TPA: hypothetical protein VIX63_15295 [Vicinamibacterales bacterium]